jgi:hypothetical protein
MNQELSDQVKTRHNVAEDNYYLDWDEGDGVCAPSYGSHQIRRRFFAFGFGAVVLALIGAGLTFRLSM